jgi:ABC-type Fe3+ transport system permease subunit
MLCRVALVRTDVSEELNATIIRVTGIGELGKAILVSLMIVALSFSETLVLTRVTRRDIPEDAILHSHRRENLKSYRE